MDTFEDAADKAGKMMNQTVAELLQRMNEDELSRLSQTLRLHLASAEGKNDLEVEELLECVEFEEVHRD